MGLRYSTFLDPEQLNNDYNDSLVNKTNYLSSHHSDYESDNDDESDQEETQSSEGEDNDADQEHNNEDNNREEGEGEREEDDGDVHGFHGGDSDDSHSQSMTAFYSTLYQSPSAFSRTSNANRNYNPYIPSRYNPRRFRNSHISHQNEHHHIPNSDEKKKLSFYQKHSKFNKNGKPFTYACCNCLTHLTTTNLIISDQYRGASGDALLIYKVFNIKLGKNESRIMTTGNYTVCDVMCHQCGTTVGWKYLTASCSNQKFKEGRYILECAYLVSAN